METTNAGPEENIRAAGRRGFDIAEMNTAENTRAPAGKTFAAAPPGVSATRLENGLLVIVREDHSAPVVSAQAWCMAGSIHEGQWLGAGLSHLLEHMLFKGTTSRPGGRIDQEVQEAGGHMNAYTSFDRTVYHIDVPSTGAGVAIDILCDIMQHASLPAEELEKEKQVILREMDMNVDDPQRRAGRRLFECAFLRSPCRFTVIGYPDIFHQLQPGDIRGYYEEKYAPNNVFFVVAGDVRRAEVVEQIRRAYAGARTRALSPVVLPEEPRPTSPREIVEEGAIELGHLHFAWHIPEARHPDVPILDALAVLLGSGRSSRLYQRVRERGLAHSADAWTYTPGGGGLFGMSAVIDGRGYTVARDAMLREIEAVRERPVEPVEVAKAIKQFVAATLAARKTMQGQAQDLGGSWLAASDLNFSARYLAAVQRVTAADAQRVAREYLNPDHMTIYALLPAGTAPAELAAVEEPVCHAAQKFELESGLRLLVKEDHRLPFVEFRAAFLGGVLAETAERNGVTQLLSKLLLKGARGRSAEQIAGEIESVGGHLESHGGNNTFGINAEVMSQDFALGLGLVADVLQAPDFPLEAMEREREIQLAGIRAQRDHLLQSAFSALRRELFGPAGYGLDPAGSEASVRALSLAEVRAFYQTRVVPHNCVLAIFGDVEAGAVRTAVEAAFSGWQAGLRKPPLGSFPAARGGRGRVVKRRDKKQAVLAIGWPGARLSDPDRYPLELIQEACSDLGSRLFLRIREELGLAYYVGAQNFAGLEPGYFAFYAGTAPDQAATVEQEILREAALLREEGLTEEELRRAKAKVLGQRKIARQDLGHLAMTGALNELFGLGYDYGDSEDALYEAVTRERVIETARKFLRPESAVVAMVRP